MIGYLKGKSSIWIAQNAERKLQNFLGHKFWARGYFVSTVRRDEEMIRAYVRNRKMADRQLDQMELKVASSRSPISRATILNSFITASGGSPQTQLCWGSLGWCRRAITSSSREVRLRTLNHLFIFSSFRQSN
jgi:putative transposase